MCEFPYNLRKKKTFPTMTKDPDVMKENTEKFDYLKL